MKDIMISFHRFATLDAAPFIAASMIATWHWLTSRMSDRYRPERHYMRGPGPKWHAAQSAKRLRQ